MKIRRVCPHTLREKWNVSAGAWWGGAHLGRLASAADLKTIEFPYLLGHTEGGRRQITAAHAPQEKEKKKDK